MSSLSDDNIHPVPDEKFYQLELLRLKGWRSLKKTDINLSLVSEVISGELVLSEARQGQLIERISESVGLSVEDLKALSGLYRERIIAKQIELFHQLALNNSQFPLRWREKWALLIDPQLEISWKIDKSLKPGSGVELEGNPHWVIRTSESPRPFLETLAIGVVMKDWAKHEYAKGSKDLAYEIYCLDPSETHFSRSDFETAFSKLNRASLIFEQVSSPRSEVLEGLSL